MGRKFLIAAVILLSLLLTAGTVYIAASEMGPVLRAPTEPETTARPSQTTAEPTTEATTEATTLPPQTTAPPETTEPQPEYFTLTFVGDCTLGSDPNSTGSGSFIRVVGEDYGYPFRNVLEYFQNDDCTFINLEGVFADGGTRADKLFAFRGPTAYGNILTEGSVEAVTLANNHSKDFGAAGLQSTQSVLDDRGIHYAGKNSSVLFDTDSGLRIGMYGVSFEMDKADMTAEVAALREQGADIVILAQHVGTEGAYQPNQDQTDYAHAAIDAGADIVWGHHPHRLQQIEEYNGGIIYYSLGNFSFGGNRKPSDMDSVILQQQVIRRSDGTVELGELTLIPCSMSSSKSVNNYQPTPYEPDSGDWKRTLSKLDGTYGGADYIPPYESAPETTGTETENTEKTEKTY